MILETKNLVKTFPGVKALHRVNFQLEKGEIHALVGAHGSGKSTLAKLLAGVYSKDSGSIVYEGKSFDPESVREAEQCGISAVLQEVNMMFNLTVAENMFLERQPKNMGFIKWKEINKRTIEILKRYNVEIDVTQEIGMYSVAVNQVVVIARALELDAKIYILDEPTSSLSNEESAYIFKEVRRIRDQGGSIIFITHFLDQVFEYCDRITVFKEGKDVGTWKVGDISREELEEKIGETEYPPVYDDFAAVQDSPEREESLNGYKLEFGGSQVEVAGLLKSGNMDLEDIEFAVVKDADKRDVIRESCPVIKEPEFSLERYPDFEAAKDMSESGSMEQTVAEAFLQALQVKRGWLTLLENVQTDSYIAAYAKLFAIADSTAQVAKLSSDLQGKVLLARLLAANPAYVAVVKSDGTVSLADLPDMQKFIILLGVDSVKIVVVPERVRRLLAEGESIELRF